MEKVKDRFQDFLWICRKNPQYVKIAVIALVVVTALVFFGTNGEKEEIPVIQTGESALEESSGSAGKESIGDVTTMEETTVTKFVVDLDGCVKKPGIYEITEGTRLYEVIEMAGGLTEKADTTSINQAEVLYDGQKIMIPERLEEIESGNQGNSDVSTSGMMADGRININQANSTMLQEIPGVGPATAEKILTYREANGRFHTIEDIKNVDGIGEKTFEKIKDRITI